MPELPEVETMVRGIRKAVEGRTIAAIVKCRCRHKPIHISPSWPRLKKRVQDEQVTSVGRVGKRVLLKLSSRDVFVIEPRMTGLMLLENPPDRGHLRLEWKLTADTSEQSLWFWDRRGLGTVRLFSAAEFEKELGPECLGYDALEMTVDRWEAVLKNTSRAIKVALLDQRCVAGIGNIYASEILHLAGISPEQPSRQLNHEALEKLADASVSVLNKAIASEGSTLGDGTYRNALNQNGRYQNQHRVYQKHGKICPTCKRGTIERIVLAQRATFFCPVCQPIFKSDN